MRLIAEASTVHVPTVDGSAAPAAIVMTTWLCGFCHRYSFTTPRYVTFLAMSNIAREWWASVGAAAKKTPPGTAIASKCRHRSTFDPCRLPFIRCLLGGAMYDAVPHDKGDAVER